MSKEKLTAEELKTINSKKGLLKLLQSKKIKTRKILRTIAYEKELVLLQKELIKLQQWVIKNQKRVVIIFEGRDAAGKGGTILRFTQHLIPRELRVVALPKPTDRERGEWYFQRYIPHLPARGEITFFDRSWYNRAVVEPAMGFCTQEQYFRFMEQVADFEHMLYEDGIIMIKFWFNLSKKEQAKRFEQRRRSPLKQWKLSPVDLQAQEKWDIFTHYRNLMFDKTHLEYSPWIIVDGNSKKDARLESIRYVLNHIDYEDKPEDFKTPNTEIVRIFKEGMDLHD
ncbi:MAG: polyphosphate kinase 2 [Bernardetiaceae bacterium]|nr:polyphosphate kinase 2 [Bernardetiaceae bacterium]